MRVLHLGAGNMYGGIERLLATFARERNLCPEMEPAFGLCFRGRLWDELAAIGVPIFDLGNVRFSRPWTLWRSRWRLSRLLRREKFDVVVTHAAWPHAAFAQTVQSARIPLVHWVHDTLTGAGNYFEERAGRVPPQEIITNTQFTAATVSGVFPGVRTEVISYPVSPPLRATVDRAAVRTELDTSSNDVVVIQASRLERWKGQSVLVEALGLLRDLPGWTAWIAGGPQKANEIEYLTELENRATALGVANRIRFLGQRNDVSRLLASADIFCQPNTGPEPFGIAFVEALYAGLPVVTADIGGGREVIDSSCGVLVPRNDPPAVASALSDLVANTSRRKTLGGTGPVRAAELCDPERQLGKVAELLRGIAV